MRRLVSREADALDLGIITALVALAQQQGGIGHRQITIRLRDLHVTLNLPHGERTTNNRLKKLRHLGEIAFETSQGKRTPLTIIVLPDDYFRNRIEASFEVSDSLEPEPVIDFEATSPDYSHESLAEASTTPHAPMHEPRNQSKPARPDQNKDREEKNPDQGVELAEDDAPEPPEAPRVTPDGAAGERALTPAAQGLPWVDYFLALLPEDRRPAGARTGVTRRVERLSPDVLHDIYLSFSRELDAGHIRKPLAYLYSLFNQSSGVRVSLPEELLEAIAGQIAAHVADRLIGQSAASTPQTSPWLDFDGACKYLGFGRDVLYKLTAARAIPARRKAGGQGLRFHQDELDTWMETRYPRIDVPAIPTTTLDAPVPAPHVDLAS